MMAYNNFIYLIDNNFFFSILSEFPSYSDKVMAIKNKIRKVIGNK